jgi:hypothetical protein
MVMKLSPLQYCTYPWLYKWLTLMHYLEIIGKHSFKSDSTFNELWHKRYLFVKDELINTYRLLSLDYHLFGINI